MSFIIKNMRQAVSYDSLQANDFKPDLVNNMDHRRISVTEPSSVIISQTK